MSEPAEADPRGAGRHAARAAGDPRQGVPGPQDDADGYGPVVQPEGWLDAAEALRPPTASRSDGLTWLDENDHDPAGSRFPAGYPAAPSAPGYPAPAYPQSAAPGHPSAGYPGPGTRPGGEQPYGQPATAYRPSAEAYPQSYRDPRPYPEAYPDPYPPVAPLPPQGARPSAYPEPDYPNGFPQAVPTSPPVGTPMPYPGQAQPYAPSASRHPGPAGYPATASVPSSPAAYPGPGATPGYPEPSYPAAYPGTSPRAATAGGPDQVNGAYPGPGVRSAPVGYGATSAGQTIVPPGRARPEASPQQAAAARPAPNGYRPEDFAETSADWGRQDEDLATRPVQMPGGRLKRPPSPQWQDSQSGEGDGGRFAGESRRAGASRRQPALPEFGPEAARAGRLGGAGGWGGSDGGSGGAGGRSSRRGPSIRRPATAMGAAFGAATEVVVVVALALTLALVIKTFLVQAFFIPSESMENTLLTGDRVLVSKLTPGVFSLHRGDIVVFKDPGGWLPPTAQADEGPVRNGIRTALTFVGLLPQDSGEHLIKRVIGMPGDHVVCCDAKGRVQVNGVAVDEVYVFPGNAPSEKSFDVTVPAGHLWVMGDHRQVSEDSRFHLTLNNGMVPISDVVGKAFVIVWPLSRATTLGVPDTVFAGVPDPTTAGP
ncbi:MAG TPA: signal peptidase I [Kineosporiaceae bacterium]|nr:signal peptidase I [Kineosporiaceae bacterium]